MWTGIAARTTLFVYNTEMLSEAELPKSMLDLADPEWQGRWGAAPAGADFQAIVSALLQLRGTDETANWLAGLKRNALAYRGNFEAMRGANVGEVAGALIYNYYYFGDQGGTGESSDKLGVHYFRNSDPGAFVSISGGGVLKASDNPDAAQAFLAFVTGPKGQAILRDGDKLRIRDRQRRRAQSGDAAARHAGLSQGRSVAAQRAGSRPADDRRRGHVTGDDGSQLRHPAGGRRARLPRERLRARRGFNGIAAMAAHPGVGRGGTCRCRASRCIPVGFVVWVLVQAGWDTAIALIFRPRVGELLVATVLLQALAVPLSVGPGAGARLAHRAQRPAVPGPLALARRGAARRSGLRPGLCLGQQLSHVARPVAGGR